MYDWKLLLMEVHKAGEDRLAPALDYAQLRYLVLFNVSTQRAAGDLSYEDDFFLLLVLPSCYKVDNIVVL